MTQFRKPIFTRNRKVAANVQVMHEKWESEQFPSRVQKQAADPKSLSTQKQQAAAIGIRVTRRMLRNAFQAKQAEVQAQQERMGEELHQGQVNQNQATSTSQEGDKQ